MSPKAATRTIPAFPGRSLPSVGVEDLSAQLARTRVTCFLCGPGKAADGFDLRAELAEHLRQSCKVEPVLGEDLPARMRRSRRTHAFDLQTLESEFAKKVDLTILMLDSPGAIAELGCFCMMPEIRCHLYVLVPARFHRTESYIARGPLDLLARMHSLTVMYYRSDNSTAIRERVGYPIMLHKFAASKYGWRYDSALRHRRHQTKSLERVMEDARADFLPSYVAAGIAVLNEPQFAEIVSMLRLDTDELRAQLRVLFDKGVIEKPRDRYRLLRGFDSDVFAPFDTGSLSKKRCYRLAVG